MSFILQNEEFPDEPPIPSFRCDGCRNLIVDATHAALVWKQKDYEIGGDIHPLIFCGSCVGRQRLKPEGLPLPHFPLDQALAWLVHKSGLNCAKLKAAEEETGVDLNL
jgi:hypothetical protein